MADKDALVELAVRVEDLKRQVDELQRQQQALIESVQELVKTFRALGMHLGITSDTYRSGSSGSGSKRSDPPPGFG